MRHGKKCRYFGRRVFRILAPSTGLADIDELDDRSLSGGLNCQIAKEFLLLGASDHYIVVALDRLQIGADIAATQRRVKRQWFRQALAQRLRIERLGLVAIANQGGHALGARYLK